MKDLREYAKQTNIRMVLGAFILLFVVGVGLIWVFYGEAAAGMGLTCLLAALFPVILILGIFVGIEWMLKNVRPK
jgi:multisubunit Na+/H+ antiporter MnhB subunit